MGSINIGEALGGPIKIMEENYDFFIPPLLPAVVDLIAGTTAGKLGFSYHASAGSIILSVISLILSLVVGGALVYMADLELKGTRANYRDGLNVAMERLVDLVIASLIIGFGFMIGLILLVIPGLIWLMLVAFALPMIMLENLDAVSAIKESINLVTANMGDVFVYLIALVLIVFIGTAVLGIIPYIGYALATIVLSPYSAISITIAYRQLTGANPEEEVFN